MHIFTMLILLSILVLVHELGHFGVARALGIKVERFGFGLPIGPTLYETVWGKTKICVHAFLLGGYVSFPDDDPDSDVPMDDPGRISNRKIWERFLVIVAGVTANIVAAFLLVLLVAVISGNLPSGKYNVFVAGVQEGKNYPAAAMDVKADDKITAVNGVKIDSPYAFIELVHRSKKFDGYVDPKKVESQMEQIKSLNTALSSIQPESVIPAGTVVKLPPASPEQKLAAPRNIVDMQSKYKPEGTMLTAAEQKLRNSIDGKKEYTADGKVTLMSLAQATSDTVHPISITLDRNGKLVELPAAYPNADGLLGIKLKSEEVSNPVKGPVQAVTRSWDYLYRNASYMIGGLVQIFTGKIPLYDLHGIVAITKVGSDIIQKSGIWNGLLLTALISMDLAIVNLLPIPALDGGHLLFLLIEKLRGKPVDEKTQEIFSKIGFMFLIGLMIFVIFNDLFALFMNKL